MLERELWRMDTNHYQACVFVRLCPGSGVRQRAKPIDTRERPELNEDDFAFEASGCQCGRVDPRGRAAERR